MNQISAFIGIAKNSANKGIYSLSVFVGNEIKTFPAKLVYDNNRITSHFIILSGLLDLLESATDTNIIFYGNSDIVKQEWDFYSKEKSFPAGTKDILLWEEIIKVLGCRNLVIKGTESILIKLNKMQDEKMKTALKNKR